MSTSARYSPRMDQLRQTMQRLDRWFANPKLARKTSESCDFRISITASDDMIERAIPGFAAAIDKAQTTPR